MKKKLYILGLCTILTGISVMTMSFKTFKEVKESPLSVSEDIDPKKEYKYKASAPIETDDYRIKFNLVENQAVFSLIKMTIINKTKGYLTIDLGEIKFDINGKTYKYKSKTKIITPKGKKNVTVKVVDKVGKMQVETFKVDIGGVKIYPITDKKLTLEKFKLPVSRNTIEEGNFKLNVKKVSKKTDETLLKMKVTYTGDHIGLIDFSKAVFVKENGEEFANVNSKSKPKLLLPGNSDNILLRAEIPVVKKEFDMQFATFYIDWKDAIKELSGESRQKHTVIFELDKEATNNQ